MKNSTLSTILICLLSFSPIFSIGQSPGTAITEFTIPGQVSVSSINQNKKTVKIGMPIGTDLSDLAPGTISLSPGATISPEVGVPQDFTVPVFYTVTAESGYQRDWKVTVEIDSRADVESPVIVSCPENDFFGVEEGKCTVSVPIQYPEATDNVSTEFTYRATRSDGLDIEAPFSGGTTTITWIVIDEALNESQPCEQEIFVNDTKAPQMDCPSDIVVFTPGAQILEIVPPTAVDNCTPQPVITFIRSDNQNLTLQDPFPQGTTFIDWTATDASGNSTTCTHTVRLSVGPSTGNDIIAFEIIGQLSSPDIDVNGKTVKVKMPRDTDVTALAPAGIVVSVGATISPQAEVAQDFSDPVVYTVTAEDGSKQEWTVGIELVGSDKDFSVECPSDIFVDNDPNQCGARVVFDVLYTTGDEPNVTLDLSHESGSVFPVGTTKVTAVLSNNAGKIEVCSFEVTVRDTEAPIISCSDKMVRLNADGSAAISIEEIGQDISDNCEVESIALNIESFTEKDVGENEVILTAADINGNSNSCATTVTVLPYEANKLSVTGFTLINADTNEPLFDISEGMKIDVGTLPNARLTIRANATEDVESVRLSLKGALHKKRTENIVPYALYGDYPSGNYFGKKFPVGKYKITATAYAKNRLAGERGKPLKINFELFDSKPPMEINGFTLIDAKANAPIFALADGLVLTFNQLPTKFLSIRADVSGDVESVRFELRGAKNMARTENIEPYALFGDSPRGNYKDYRFAFGTYVLTATPYSKNRRQGTKGTSLTIRFEIIDPLRANNFNIIPNEVSTYAMAVFKQPTQVNRITVFDILGRIVESFEPRNTVSLDSYKLNVSLYPPGTYFVNIINANGKSFQKQMVVRRQ